MKGNILIFLEWAGSSRRPLSDWAQGGSLRLGLLAAVGLGRLNEWAGSLTGPRPIDWVPAGSNPALGLLWLLHPATGRAAVTNGYSLRMFWSRSIDYPAQPANRP